MLNISLREEKMSFDTVYPVHLALILEKGKIISWSNKSMDLNTNTFWVDNNWYFLANQILRYEMYYQNTWVTEQSAIDNIFNENLILNSSRLTLINIYYSYFSKFRTIILTNTGNSVNSIDRIFKNCNWLERETSEMYGVNFIFKTDSRKLLLDYSKIEHPLLKDFPSEGVKDVFYDILDNQVNFSNNETTEL